VRLGTTTARSSLPVVHVDATLRAEVKAHCKRKGVFLCAWVERALREQLKAETPRWPRVERRASNGC
jgi:hypothetical protein